MNKEVIVQNLKCGGCAGTIQRELTKLEGITDVQVDKDTSTVSFQSDKEDVSELLNRLNDLGYPPMDDDNSLYKKAKSYVSCMVGRVSTKDQA